VDLLIFLDSPQALSSRWVYQELARAHDLGLGVLQLIWPNHARTSGTEFSDPITLQQTDFVGQQADADDRLTDAALTRVTEEAERARIRSLAARRIRVVADLVDQAIECGLEAIVHPVDRIEFRRAGNPVGVAVPLVGLPDAVAIQTCEVVRDEADLSRVRIVYNGLGMDADWAKHLDWLNRHHRIVVTQVDEIGGWLRELT
jgi:hypothetical protein